MNPKDVLFSINECYMDGSISEPGIFLHFGDTKIKVAENITEFKLFADRIARMVKEIEENY